jgi:hypothetical protein
MTIITQRTSYKLSGLTYTGTYTQLNYNSNVPIGICVASKILTVDSNRNLLTINNLTSIGTLNATSISGTLLTSTQPNITNLGILTSLATNNIIITNHNGSTTGLKLSNVLVTASATQLNYLMVTPGLASANKAMILDNNRNIKNINNITTTSLYTNNLYINNLLLTATATKLNYNDISTLGMAEANKALILDTNRNINNINSITSTNAISTNLTGTLFTANQTNITSVGTLTGLSVANTLTVGGSITSSGTISGIKTLTSSTITGTLTTTPQPNITSIGTQTIVNANNCNITTTNTTNVTLNGTSLATSATKLNYNNITTAGTAEASKSLITDVNSNISNINSLTLNSITSNNIYGTLQTAAQPNITSLGSLSSLTVTNNIENVRNITMSGNLSLSINSFGGTPISYIRNILYNGNPSNYKNSSFYEYILDGDEYYLLDGGNDMFDSGNYTTAVEFNGSSIINTTNNLSYTNTIGSTQTFLSSNTIVNTCSLGYLTPLMMLTKFSTTNTSSYFGIRKIGNLGADTAGTKDSGYVYPTNSYGVSCLGFYQRVYNAGTDSSVCDLFFIISTNSLTGNSIYYPSNGSTDIQDCGLLYRGSDVANCIFGNVLLSVANAVAVSTGSMQNILNNICYFISQAGNLNSLNSDIIYGTLSTANQSNITSVGNLTNLTVSGNIGVNTTNPSKKIEINNSIGGCLRTYYNKISYPNVFWDFNINSSGYLTLNPNQSTQKTLIQNNLKLGIANNSSPNIIRFNGVTGDASNDMSVIAERLYAGNDFSELLLFKGNDSSTPLGPDRIRLRSGAIVLQTYNSPETYDNYNDNNYRFILDNNNKITMGDISNSIIINGNINSSYAQYDLNVKVLSLNTPLRLTYNDNNGSASIYNDIFLISNNIMLQNTSNTFTLGSSDNGLYEILIGPNDNAVNTGSLKFINSSNINYIQSGSNINQSSSADLFIGNIDTTTSTSSRKFIIKSDGKVGINTISPLYQLDINSTNGNCLELIYNNINGTASTYTTQILDNLGNATITAYGSAPLFTFSGGNISANLLTSSQPNITSLGTQTSLNVNGNLTGITNLTINNLTTTYNLNSSYLIGTILTAKQPFITKIGNLPSLSLNGYIKVGSYSKTLDFLHVDKNVNGLIGITIENTNSTSTTSGCQILFSGYSNSSSQYEVAKISSITKASDNPSLYQYSDLVFSTRRNNTDTSTTEAMRILNTGNIGIGITTPIVTLDINNNINANQILLGNSTNITDFLSCNVSTIGNGTYNSMLIIGKNTTTGNSYITDYYHASDNSSNNTLRIYFTGNSYSSLSIANNKVAINNLSLPSGSGNIGLNVDGTVRVLSNKINVTGTMYTRGTSSYLSNTTFNSASDLYILNNINIGMYMSAGSVLAFGSGGVNNGSTEIFIWGSMRCEGISTITSRNIAIPNSYAYGYSNGTTGTAGAQTNPYSGFFGNTVCNGGYVIPASDFRLKKDINNIEKDYCMNFINNIKSYSFNMKDEKENPVEHFGFIAQDLLKYKFNDLVTFYPDENLNEEVDENGIISPDKFKLLVSIKQILPLLANCLKFYYNEFNKIEDKINSYIEVIDCINENSLNEENNNLNNTYDCKYTYFMTNKDNLYNNLLEIEDTYLN